MNGEIKLIEKARIIGERVFQIGNIDSIEVLTSNDGDLLFTSGKSNTYLYDITAFIGSVSDPISKSLRIEKANYLVVEEKGKFIVIIIDDVFIIGVGCKEGVDPDIIAQNSIKAINPEKGMRKEIKGGISSSKELRLLISKVKQINLLVEEFSKENKIRPWLDLVERKLEEFRGSKRVVDFFEIKEENLSLTGIYEEIDEKEVNIVSKVLIDSLCRLAIEKLGPEEAKSKVHIVIKKMGFLSKKKGNSND